MKHNKMSLEEVARYWDENADTWTEHVRKGWDAYREYFNKPAFFKFIGNLKGKLVLDAGCGEGYNTRLLARSGARVVGIDISERMIELARKEEQKNTLGIRYEVLSFSALSLFDTASFDMVISFMALMDSPEYEATVQELFRVLRKNGEFVFSITHPCFLTKGMGWIEDEQDKTLKLTVSHYFDHEPVVEHWGFSKGPAPKDVRAFAVPSFSRTLSDYLNTLTNAGFLLKRIGEPRPTRKACRNHSWLQRWRDHAAMFLYVCAVKP